MTDLSSTLPDLGNRVDVAVARQPIVDRDRRVVGFELLYRSTEADPVRRDGEQMTAQVVLGALSIGLEQLVGDKVMFCNAERGVLVGETPVTLPPDRTVIEVLETVAVDDESVAGCRALVDRGFILALDDFVWGEGAERLLELASIVKIDVLALSRDEVADLVRRCRPYGVRMLAEKVETDEDVAWAMDLGFELFQGYAIERPNVVRRRTVGVSVAGHVQLAANMLGNELDLDEVETILRREPGLVVQVLQMASVGSHGGLRQRVRTLREALVLLGTRRLRQWIALTVLKGQRGHSPDGLATALARAATCELLASERGLGSVDFAFTAGLLSSLDLMLGIDARHLDATLDLDDGLKAAALRREGPLGELITQVARYQHDVAHGTVPADLPADLDAAAAAAFTWAMPYVNALDAPARRA